MKETNVKKGIDPTGNQDFYHATFDSLLEGCQVIDFGWHYHYLNPVVEQHSRRPNSELLGRTFQECWPGIETTELFQKINTCLADRVSTRMENRFDYPDGKVGWFQISIQPVPEGAMILSYDLTERVEAERMVVRIKRLYATLSQVNQTIVRTTSRDDLFRDICQIAIDFGKCSLAWIGLLDEATGDVTPVASTGLELSQWPFDPINIHKGGMKNAISARAIRSSKTVVSGDVRTEKIHPRLDRQLEAFPFRATASVPIFQGGKAIGALTLLAPEPGIFTTDEELQLINEMGLDISFALDNLEKERVRRQWLDAFEHCGHGIALGSPEADHLLTCNPAFARMHGGTVEDICAVPSVNYYRPEDLGFFMEKIRESDLSGSVQFDARKFRLDGSLFDVHVNLVNVTGKDGRVIYRVLTQHDITERKKDEEKLRISEQLLSLFVKFAPAAIAMFDRNMNYIAVSDRFISDYRIGDQNLIGRSHYEVFPELDETIRAIHRRCLSGASEKGDETPFLRKDGTLDWVRWEVHPWYESENRIGGIILFSELITAQINARQAIAKSELKYRFLAENVSDVIWIMDVEAGRFTYVSPSVERLRGYTVEEVMAQDVSESLTPPSAKKLAEELPKRIAGFLQGDTEPRTDEVEQPCRDGKTVWTESTTRFVRVPDTGKLLVYGVSRDITARKKVEQALRESEEKFRKAFETSPEVITINRASDGVYVSVNKGFTDKTGFSAEEVIGKGIAEIGLWAFPEDLETFVATIREHGSLANFECPFKIKDGSIRYGLTSASTLEIDGVLHILSSTHDITEQKQAIDELRASEEKFRSLIECSDSVIATIDASGMFHYANEVAASMLGVPANEIVGRYMSELFPPNIAEHHMAAVGTVIETNRGYTDETLLTINGRDHWMRNNLQPVVDSSGKPVLAMLNAQDITAWKKAREEVDRIGRYYQALIKNAPDGFVLINAAGQFAFISPAAYKIMGYDPSDPLPANPATLTHPDDLPTVLENLEKVAQDPAFIPTIQYRFKGKDGSWRWIESTFSNKLADPDLQAILINFRDIERRKKTEAALRVSEALFSGTFHTSPIPILITEFETAKFLEVNEAFLAMSGYTRSEVLGRTVWDLDLYADPGLRKNLLSMVRSKQRVSNQEVEINLKSGKKATLLVSMEKLDVAGEEHLLTLSIDITDRKAAEAEIMRLNQELEDRVTQRTAELKAANQDMEAFSYSVSHDLRAPLRGINGFARILMTDYADRVDEEGKRICTVISDSANRMAQLIDDLLAFSRLVRAGMTISRIPMRAVAMDAFREARESWPDKPVEARIDVTHDISGDQVMLRQVWINLLANALKYSSTREVPVIEVTSRIEGKMVVYSVKDNGVGFDMKYADKLFGVFQRLHSLKDFSGTGVGLAIVHRIILRHGGKVWGEATVDNGATFCFSLPAAQNYL